VTTMQPVLFRSAKFLLGFLTRLNWERIFLVTLTLVSLFSLFYNLELSPRTWHDEGAAMLLARTVAEDGVYSVRNSGGYQSFGPVQSVGPTVILPVALSFKLFGAGILQGRMVAVLFACVTLVVIYKLGKSFFGFFSTMIGLFLLIGSTSAQFLYFGRQPLGEAPALCLFLAGWYCWFIGKQRNVKGYYALAGILIGLSMVTKSSYVVLGGVLLFALCILDIIYYRQKNLFPVLGIAATASLLVIGWILFQRLYFGNEVFTRNAGIMRELGQATTGLSLFNIYLQAKFLLGSKSDYFYFLLGIPSLFYAAYLSIQKDERGFLTAALTLFAGLWLAYYFYSVPWPAYLFVPSALVALFTGKLWHDLISKFCLPPEKLIEGLEQERFTALVQTGILYTVLIMFILYPLQNAIQFHVLGRDNAPQQLAEFMNREVDQDILVETWERELGILTDHLYHFPEQSRLIDVHAAKYRQSSQGYLLGYEYFNKTQPSFLVVGRFAREFPLYDPSFLSQNATVVAQFGDDGLGAYEIFEINYPLIAP